MTNSLTLPQSLPDEKQVEASLRPQFLSDFTGQASLCANLKVFIESAKKRQEPLDHILFYGPPGLGKTTLAQIIAREMGTGFRSTSGPMLSKAGDLAAILTNLQPYDVLFIDEIHRLNTAVEEVLYPAMEDFQLDLMIGEGATARSIKIDLPRFTLVGATTRTGLLTNPLRDRFGIPLRLDFYSVADLTSIVQRLAAKLDLTLMPDAAVEVAKRARGTPRIAGRLLRRVQDFAIVTGDGKATQALVDHALNRLDVDANGLDTLDQRYLSVIADTYNGGPVGLDTMAAVLSEARDAIEDVIEPFLLQQGFIQRTPRGRMLTHKAYSYLGRNAPASLANNDLFSDVS
jgi:Holliday junction DNA helicase RuvB